ncbi:hypothetical protein AVEN_239466-1 [Araneus ventricosus]|uniref:Uncharacterized protein n=1 Tax=Araneus ventricosus TaxID=182803 RepID=A0A4Y2MW22_ARAVE|nr:hypothetical protein AVEN_239466-1 [Araneus ventricosus]
MGDTDTIDYLLEVDTNNHLPSLILSSPPSPVNTHAEYSNNGLPDRTFSSEASANILNSRDYHAFEEIKVRERVSFSRKVRGDDEEDHDYIVSDSEHENCASD